MQTLSICELKTISGGNEATNENPDQNNLTPLQGIFIGYCIGSILMACGFTLVPVIGIRVF